MLNSLEIGAVSENGQNDSALSNCKSVRGLLYYLRSGMPRDDLVEVASVYSYIHSTSAS